MDHLRERLTVAVRAIETLRELALLSGPTRTERDAAIQRFEYSFEATWKAGSIGDRYALRALRGEAPPSPSVCQPRRGRPRAHSGAGARRAQDRVLGTSHAIFVRNRGTYASPRIHRSLRAGSARVSRRRVEQLRRGAGLRARAAKL